MEMSAERAEPSARSRNVLRVCGSSKNILVWMLQVQNSDSLTVLHSVANAIMAPSARRQTFTRTRILRKDLGLNWSVWDCFVISRPMRASQQLWIDTASQGKNTPREDTQTLDYKRDDLRDECNSTNRANLPYAVAANKFLSFPSLCAACNLSFPADLIQTQVWERNSKLTTDVLLVWGRRHGSVLLYYTTTAENRRTDEDVRNWALSCLLYQVCFNVGTIISFVEPANSVSTPSKKRGIGILTQESQPERPSTRYSTTP